MTRHRIGWALGSGLLVALAMLPMSPALLNPYEDSGAYAYVGQVIYHGGVPYRDAWDHKPPLTFYLDALSFAVGGENRWALWGLGVVTGWITAWLMAALLHEVGLSRRLVVLGTAGFVLVICRADWQGTNTPEFYGLPFQTLALWAGCRLLRDPRARWGLLAGFAVGLALLAKQTTFAAAVTLIPAVILIRRSLRPLGTEWKTWLALAGGALIAPGVLALYLAARGALPDAVNALWTFNRAYGGRITLPAIGRSMLDCLPVTHILAPLAFFALIGAAAGRGWRTWLGLTCLLDFVLTNLAARGYAHYFFTPLPAFTVLVVAGIGLWLDRNRLPRLRPVRWATWTFLALVVLIPSLLEMVLALAVSGGHLIGPAKTRPVIDYVRAHSSPGDTVLNWGHASSVNFGADRRSPSRYSYTQPLAMPGYTTPEEIAAFLADLEQKRPVLIVDSTMPGIPVPQELVPPLSRRLQPVWQRAYGGHTNPALDGVFDFVAEHCTLKTVITYAMIYHCQYEAAGG